MRRVFVILCPFIVVLLIGCAAPPPENLMTAADKREQAHHATWVVYTLPEMNRVSVASVTYKETLTMDVYYPPDFDFRSRLPAVVFVNAGITPHGPELKDSGQGISWGQLTAASGLIGVTYDSRDGGNAPDNLHDLMKYIRENGGSLRIDSKRIGLWSCWEHVWVAQSVLMDTSQEYQRDLRCAVFYYGGLDTGEPTVKEWRRDVPQFVVKAGQCPPWINTWLDEYVVKAREMGIPLEFVEYEEAGPFFDYAMDTDRSREIIKQTLDFMATHLLKE